MFAIGGWVDFVFGRAASVPQEDLLRQLNGDGFVEPEALPVDQPNRLIGTSEGELRALSALFGTVTVPLTYAAGRILVSRAGLYVAGLVTCSPSLVWYSQEARAYALFLALITLSLLAFAHVLLRPSGRGFVLE